MCKTGRIVERILCVNMNMCVGLSVLHNTSSCTYMCVYEEDVCMCVL